MTSARAAGVPSVVRVETNEPLSVVLALRRAEAARGRSSVVEREAGQVTTVELAFGRCTRASYERIECLLHFRVH